MPKRLLILTGLLLQFAIWAQTPVPQKPKTLVSDFAGLLEEPERTTLESKLVAFNDSTSTQIAVVTEKSLEGGDDFDRAMSLAESWGVGRSGKDNGILIYVAVEERKIRILTGYGAEGFLTDAMSRRIIEQVIKPAFRSRRYFEGLDEATNVIMSLHAGEFQSDLETTVSPLVMVVIFVFFFLLIVILSSYFRKRSGQGYYRGGRYFRDNNWSGGGWYSGGGGGWSSGGGGGGGFGGFGGGHFGGGGAGGGW